MNLIRTIEVVLKLAPINLNDAIANPMLDVFSTAQKKWQYFAEPSSYLFTTQLFPPQAAVNKSVLHPNHDAKYWANATRGLNFNAEDLLDGEAYNKILWKGLMGDKPYPTAPSGLDLRQNRSELLSRFSQTQQAGKQARNNSAAAPKGGE